VHPSTQETYTRETSNQKKKKKVMQDRNMEIIIGSHPMENGVKEKGI
jgi:hypothetical protein